MNMNTMSPPRLVRAAIFSCDLLVATWSAFGLVVESGNDQPVRLEAYGSSYACGRSTVVLQAGQTQRVDFARATGFPIRGQVVGLAKARAPGAFIFVRQAEAAGDPLFDAVTSDETGHFSTARLEPGTYTVVVEVYLPESPTGIFHSGIRLPDYVGTAKVSVSAGTPPALVSIELNRRPFKTPSEGPTGLLERKGDKIIAAPTEDLALVEVQGSLGLKSNVIRLEVVRQ